MSNKQKAAGTAFGGGLLVALGAYLAAMPVLALAVVREALPETGLFPTVAAVCALASLAGSRFCVRRSPMGRLPSALLCALAFAAVLAAVGSLAWEGVAWAGEGGLLLACALGGGLCAGLPATKRGRRVKRRPGRR